MDRKLLLTNLDLFQSALRDRRFVADAESSSDCPESHPLRQPGVRQIGRRQSSARTQQTGSGATGSGTSDEFTGEQFLRTSFLYKQDIISGENPTTEHLTRTIHVVT